MTCGQMMFGAVDLKATRSACRARNMIMDPRTYECRAPLRRPAVKAGQVVYGPALPPGMVLVKAPRKPRAKKALSLSQIVVGVPVSTGRRPRAVAVGHRGRPTKFSAPIVVLRQNCKAQGKVLDLITGNCRARASRGGASRGGRPLKFDRPIYVLRKDCQRWGQVFDPVTGKCRPSRRTAPPRKPTRFPGGSLVSLRQGCRSKGLVFDLTTGQCRQALARRAPPRKQTRFPGGSLVALRQGCRSQGLVFDLATGNCRSALPRGRRAASFGSMASHNMWAMGGQPGAFAAAPVAVAAPAAAVAGFW